ncbi:hypothetical protein ABIE67_000147 [Streptomyces sp. V4I8]
MVNQESGQSGLDRGLAEGLGEVALARAGVVKLLV